AERHVRYGLDGGAARPRIGFAEVADFQKAHAAGFQQRVRCAPPSSTGNSRAQTSIIAWQRGWKVQPAGRLPGGGTVPGMAGSLAPGGLVAGMVASSASV